MSYIDNLSTKEKRDAYIKHFKKASKRKVKKLFRAELRALKKGVIKTPNSKNIVGIHIYLKDCSKWGIYAGLIEAMSYMFGVRAIWRSAIYDKEPLKSVLLVGTGKQVIKAYSRIGDMIKYHILLEEYGILRYKAYKKRLRQKKVNISNLKDSRVVSRNRVNSSLMQLTSLLKEKLESKEFRKVRPPMEAIDEFILYSYKLRRKPSKVPSRITPKSFTSTSFRYNEMTYVNGNLKTYSIKDRKSKSITKRIGTPVQGQE